MENYRPFKRVLIANRGEIAVRIIRTLRELNIESIAVYSDADASSQHRKLADYAIRLAGRSSAETYLNIPQLLKAIQDSGADAIHPGYGFLSESSEFCKEVTALGCKFIGPSTEAMETMGNKVSAKTLMIKHQVPTVPGSEGEVHSLEELRRVVEKIGFPIILKAAAGGGGRGMREVWDDQGLDDAFAACSREAQAYFGNPAVFAERFIQNPRHIEIQVLCDGKNGVHLYERDCSIQRRHQKLIEEAPSLYLNSEHREKLGSLAVTAALAAGYEGVGTVEFICESPDQCYFMEMNTRIQVEHPVTECITGIDLIKEQVLVAMGQSLRLQQKDIELKGWAFEARINAEDPLQGFLPNPGKIENLTLPYGPFVRVDTHIYPGYTIPSEYDSMIAKLIVWGATRDEALDRLKRALSELEIGGVTTTARFHEAILDHPQFRSGEFNTGFIVEQGESLLKAMADYDSTGVPQASLVAALLAQKPSPPREALGENQRQSWTKTAIHEGQNQ